METQYRDAVVSAIRKLIASKKLKIPAYPTQAARLSTLLENPDYRMDQVVDLVKTDQSLSAQVLRCASSAVGGQRRAVTSLESAISFMGMEQLLSLACTSGMHSNVAAQGPLVEVRRNIWIRTVLRAQASESIAKYRGADSGPAFMCGLLCDFGKVVTLRCVEHVIAGQATAGAMPVRFWLEIIQLCESEVGLLVAEQWNLPDTLQRVMKSIATRTGEGDPLVDAVLAADQVVGVLRSHACVTLTLLEACTHLRDAREREHVLNAIPRLVEAAARLCPEAAAPKKEAKSQVSPDKDPRWEAYPGELSIEVKRSTATHNYISTSVAFDGVEMEGFDPLPTHELIRVKVQTASGEIAVFGNVVSVTPYKGGHRLSLRFFAVPKEVKVVWDGVVQALRRAVA